MASVFEERTLLRSVSWNQIFQIYEESIPDSLRRTALKMEYTLWLSRISGKSTIEMGGKYEDFGKKVLRSKDIPDWESIAEKLSQMCKENQSSRDVVNSLPVTGNSLPVTVNSLPVTVNSLPVTGNSLTVTGKSSIKMGGKYEDFGKKVLNSKVPGKSSRKIGKIFEDFGTKVFSRKEHQLDSPDSGKVAEKIDQMCEEYDRSDEKDSLLYSDKEILPKQKTKTRVYVDDIHGKRRVFNGVIASDYAETLFRRIEKSTKVPKHKLALFCNGKRLEEKELLKNYDIDISPIILLGKGRGKYLFYIALNVA